MGTFYNIKRVVSTGPGPQPPAYWVESTAPINVDDDVKPAAGAGAAAVPPPAITLQEIPDADDAIMEIAQHLKGDPSPELVVMVHGFNNPTPVVLGRFEEAYKFIAGEPCIAGQKGLVCLGYRWPSESMGAPARPPWQLLRAAPGFLLGMACIALTLLVLSRVLADSLRNLAWLRGGLYVTGLLLLAVPLVLLLLRTVVYFRDTYRAAQYGVPDLVEVFRHLNYALAPGGKYAGKHRVKLSFVGHSMGAFVVTSLVRILSDVFDSFQPAVTLNHGQTAKAEGDIGDAFRLGRLVLVSPDIPAEALMSRRANFLAPSLRRFEEAFLFSNEGDVVLRLISTLANYFSFPSRDRSNGFRLGNAEVLGPNRNSRLFPYGIVNLSHLRTHPGIAPDVIATHLRYFLSYLRVGQRTLLELHSNLAGPANAGNPLLVFQGSLSPLPLAFTCFECTDYQDIDPQNPGRVKAYLTRAKGKDKLSWYNHWSLLVTYLWPFRWGKVDVHSGYFDGKTAQHLIFGLACLGIHRYVQCLPTVPGGGGVPTGTQAGQPSAPEDPLDQLSDVLSRLRIRSLLSPIHYNIVTNQGDRTLFLPAEVALPRESGDGA